MARTKATLSTGARLSDYLSASLLARVYFCIALSLYPDVAFEQVFDVIAHGRSWMQGNRGVNEGTLTIRKSSISEMRSKRCLL